MKKVLVVHNDQLFGMGVENLLARDKDLLVIGIAIESMAKTDIDEFQPEVIVLDEALVIGDLNRIVEMFKDCEELRVLVINLRNNRVTIYDKHEIPIAQSDDLVQAIKHDLDPVGE